MLTVGKNLIWLQPGSIWTPVSCLGLREVCAERTGNEAGCLGFVRISGSHGSLVCFVFCSV